MSNFVKTFQPRFVEAVRNGTKTQTIRKTPKRIPKAGDTLSLRTWTGRPYNSKQEILGDAVVTEVHSIQMLKEHIVSNGVKDGERLLVLVDGVKLCMAEICQIARDDGFNDWLDMVQWFESNHGFPFQGILIRWRFV